MRRAQDPATASMPRQRFAAGQSKPVIAVVPPTSASTVANWDGLSATVGPGDPSGTREVLTVGQALWVSAKTPKPAWSSATRLKTYRLESPHTAHVERDPFRPAVGMSKPYSELRST